MIHVINSKFNSISYSFFDPFYACGWLNGQSSLLLDFDLQRLEVFGNEILQNLGEIFFICLSWAMAGNASASCCMHVMHAAQGTDATVVYWC